MYSHLITVISDKVNPVFSSQIGIGHNLLDEKTDLLSAHIGKNRVVIVTSERIAPLYLQPLKSKLTDYPLQEIILPDGEQWKNWQTLNKIFDRLMEY